MGLFSVTILVASFLPWLIHASLNVVNASTNSEDAVAPGMRTNADVLKDLSELTESLGPLRAAKEETNRAFNNLQRIGKLAGARQFAT